jgi:hypothetical protein
MAERAGLLDDLPVYVGDADVGAHADPREDPPGGPRRHPVHDALAVVGHAAHAVGEHVGSTSGSDSGAIVSSQHGLVIPISHHLVIAPAVATAAFDRWFEGSAGRVDTGRGHLLVEPRRSPARAPLRSLGGRLVPRRSVAPITVELDLVPWGRWRSVLTLHPSRRLRWAVAHRHYFAAGHAVMDEIVRELTVLAEMVLGPASPVPAGPPRPEGEPRGRR